MKHEVRRIQVVFSKQQYDLIQKLKGEMGLSDSEVIRNIVLAWLVEKSFVSATLKNRIFGLKIEPGETNAARN
jgi:hypothetical protein